MIDSDTFALFEATADYYGIEFASPAHAGEAFRHAAGELRFPGFLDPGDKQPPAVYAAHNYVLRALGTHVKRHSLALPDGAICGAERPLGTCGRLRVPGFDACHWHGTSSNPDEVILARMKAEVRP